MARYKYTVFYNIFFQQVYLLLRKVIIRTQVVVQNKIVLFEQDKKYPIFYIFY